MKSGDRTEMVEEVGVGAADLGGDRLERDRRGALFEQQRARGGDRGGAAFVLRKALTRGNVIDINVSYDHVSCSNLGVHP